MAKKVFLQDENKVELLPITRGELILDSSGRMALHSNEFLASTSQPGLMSSEDKKKIDNVKTDDSLSTTSVNPVQNKVVTSAINHAQTDATDAKTTANANKEELTKTQQIINTIKTSYLKSASVSGNTLTIKDQNDSEVKFYNTTYGVVSSSTNGLAPAIGTSVSSIIGNQAEEWVLTSTKGGTPTWRKLPVNAFLNNNDNTTYTLSGALSGNTFVSTLKPSSGTNTTSTVPAMTAASASAAGKAGLIPAPPAGAQGKVLSGAGTWISIPTLSITDSETGNAVTDVTVSGHSITLKRGSVFSLQGHTHATSDITSLTGYSKASSIAALATSDTLNAALGKLEYKADSAWNWISSVTATDPDEYINKWGEIVDFVDSVKEGTDILDEFVTRKTAQTITGAKSFGAPLYLGSYGVLGFGSPIDDAYTDGIDLEPEDNAVWLATTGGGYESAGILLDGSTIKLWSPMDNSPVFIDSDSGVNYGILHSGNSSVSKSGETLTVKINGTSQSLTNTKYTTLPNPYSISFKNTSNTTVSYNGSSALDLTGGIYHATTSKVLQSTRYDSDDPNPNTTVGTTFQFSNLSNIGWSNVLTMKSHIDHNYTASQLVTPASNPGKDTGYSGDMRWRQGRNSTWLDWKIILDSGNYTNYINETNFPGIKKVGTITGVTAGDGLDGGGSSGSVTLTNTGVRSTTINENYLRVNTNGTNTDLTIPYATRSSILGDDTMTLVPQYGNEINIGGTTNKSTIYIGYRAVDSKPIPTQFIFGGITGTATLKAGGFMKTGSNDDYALLGGGGHKNISNVQNTAFYKRVVNVNGANWDMAGTINSSAFTIYAPTTVGSSTQILASAGSGAPTWRTPGAGLAVTATAIDLSESGVEENTYGQTTNIVGNNEVKITIPEFTVDVYGRITEAFDRTYTAKNYYPTTFSWTNGSTLGPTGSLTGTGMSAVSFGAIPSASNSTSGVITTDAQTIAGDKTFNGAMTVNNTITFSTNDTYGIRTETDNYVCIGDINKAFYRTFTNYIGTNSVYPLSYYRNLSTSSGSDIGTSTHRFYNAFFANRVCATNGFFQDSDERLKNILEPVKVNLDDLIKLRKVFYTWKNDNSNSKQLGMIAQDVYELYPELVTIDKETGYMSLAYDRLSVISLEAIDELYKIVRDLKSENEKLRSDLKILNLTYYGN